MCTSRVMYVCIIFSDGTEGEGEEASATALWRTTDADGCALGHADKLDKLVPTCVDAQHFAGGIVTVAAGCHHTAAVTEHGGLYTWGKGRDPFSEGLEAIGLGHGDMLDKLVPTLVAPHLLQGARVGRCHRLQREHAVAFAMGSHHRLGEGSLVYSMPVEAVRSVVEESERRRKEEAEGEGVVRVMGGGKGSVGGLK